MFYHKNMKTNEHLYIILSFYFILLYFYFSFLFFYWKHVDFIFSPPGHRGRWSRMSCTRQQTCADGGFCLLAFIEEWVNHWGKVMERQTHSRVWTLVSNLKTQTALCGGISTQAAAGKSYFNVETRS